MKSIPFKPFPNLVCLEHGVNDSFPCPWPGCKHGLSEDRFELNLRIESDKKQIYRRCRWQSPLEGVYFSWEREDWPHWFFIKKTFWNEVRRLKLLPEDNANVVYHYTSMDALVSIVESDSIWLSDYSYLNDKTELIHGVKVVSTVIDEVLAAGVAKELKNLLQAWKNAASSPLSRVCVASFSGDGDSLSQWRAYGNVAIGFVPHEIGIHTNQSQLGVVQYEPETQKKLAQVYVAHASQAYLEDIKNGALDRIPDVYHRFGQVLELASFFKDPSFRDEREFRLVYVEHPELFKEDGHFERPPKHFRVKDGRIYSHVKSSEMFPFPDQKWPLGICEIVLGPESDDLMELGVREFLNENGLVEVPIRRSKIPYRT